MPEQQFSVNIKGIQHWVPRSVMIKMRDAKNNKGKEKVIEEFTDAPKIKDEAPKKVEDKQATLKKADDAFQRETSNIAQSKKKEKSL